jgi:hypothetical protein
MEADHETTGLHIIRSENFIDSYWYMEKRRIARGIYDHGRLHLQPQSMRK